jgi:VWFA-related protein
MRHLPWLALALVAVAAWPAAGHTEPAEFDYKVEIDPKSVFSTVREKDGNSARIVSLQFQIKRLREGDVIIGVPREEILVEEDGQKVAGLEVIQPRGQKLSIVLAMDISGSMARGRKMEEAKQAALAFLDRLDERADVGLILFDHLVKVAEPPVRDPAKLPGHKAKLKQIIRDARPEGGTAYLDATVRAVQMLRGVEGRRVVIVMTDGVDMNSKATLKDAIHAALIGEVPVYTVGIGEPGRNEPVTTVLVLDHSGSMAAKADEKDDLSRMEALKRAAARFVELMRPTARTTLLPFSTTVGTPLPFTGDKDALKRRILALEPSGGTLLYDATHAGLETLMAGELKGRRAVVVLTDGKDEAPGSRHSDDDVIDRARETKIPLYMLGLGRPDEINEDAMKKMASKTGGEYYHAGSQQKLLEVFEHLSIQLHDDGIDEAALGELAAKTGGKYTHVSKAAELQVFYERLADELQSTYKVTFESRRPSHDGTARGIDVKVLRKGKVVSTGGAADVVARGVAVPQMSYGVYLFFLAALAALLAAPAAVRRIYRGFGGA